MRKYTDKELTIKVAEEVEKLNGRAYYVGGYVRDKYLGKENKDIDVEVLGITEQDYVNILGKFGTVDLIGSSFGVFVVKGYDIDFSMARLERKNGTKRTDFEVVTENVTLEQAYTRRDFTINALMEDILTGKVTGCPQGVSDLEKGVITFVSKETFVEDELRAFRACQFASRFGFKIDKEVIELSKTFDYQLSEERIYEELCKLLLKSNKPSVGLEYLNEMEIFDKVITSVEYTAELGTYVDNVAELTRELNESCRRNLLFTALFENGDLKQVSRDSKMRTFYNSLKTVVSKEEFTESKKRELFLDNKYFNTLLLSKAKGYFTDEEYKELLKVSFPTRPFVTGEMLLTMGYVQGKELGKALQKAKEMQVNGKSKEEILSSL